MVVKGALSLGLLAWIVSTVDLRGVAAHLNRLDLLAAGGALALLGAQAWLAALRWHLVCRAFGPIAPVTSMLRFSLIAQFFSQALPSTVGGDVIRTWLYHRYGATVRAALLSTVGDRIVGLTALLLIIIVGMTLDTWHTLDGSTRASVIGLTAAAALSVAGVCLAARPARLLDLNRWTRLGRDLSRGLRTLLATRTYLASLGTSSVAIHLLSVGSLWVLGNGLHLEVEGVVLFVAVPVAIFATMIPVSIAGWGVREGVMVAILGAFGVSREGAFAMSLLFGVALAVVSLPGAVLWLSGATKAERAVADVQDAYRTL